MENLVIRVDFGSSVVLHNVETLDKKIISALRNIGLWRNPEYWKKKNMGLFVRNIPKEVKARKLIIEDDNSRSLIYERGLWSDIKALFERIGTIILKVNSKQVVRKPVDFPDFKLTLEDYQENDINTVLKGPAQGIISYPTGGGKTIVAAALLGKLKQRTLICVHTRDLAEQWKRVLTTKCYDNLSVSMVGGGKTDFSGKHVVIGTVQTLKNWTDKPEFQDFGCVILDECHHVAAPSFTDVVGKSNALYRFGLSATLKRQDGKDFLLQAVFGNVLTCLTYKDIEERIELPDVVKIEYSSKLEIPDDLYTERGDQEFIDMVNLHKFLLRDTDRTFMIIELAEKLIEEGDCVLILVKLRDHAAMLHEFLSRKYGSKIGLLMGGAQTKKKQEEKARIINEANKGNIRCIIGTSIADEGLDIARLNVLIMAAPSSFDGLIKQRMGRIIRKHPDKNRKPVIYDIVDTNIPETVQFWLKRKKLYNSIGINIEGDTQ